MYNGHKIKKEFGIYRCLLEILLQKHNECRREGSTVHVSDILPSKCLRRQYCGRKFPDMAPLTHESVHHFVRGEASEFVVTQLAHLGVSQRAHMDVIDPHSDVMGSDMVVEPKNSKNGKRLDFSDSAFRSYPRQLLYYLTIKGIEWGSHLSATISKN
jgi:hypothetical protein